MAGMAFENEAHRHLDITPRVKESRDITQGPKNCRRRHAHDAAAAHVDFSSSCKLTLLDMAGISIQKEAQKHLKTTLRVKGSQKTTHGSHLRDWHHAHDVRPGRPWGGALGGLDKHISHPRRA